MENIDVRITQYPRKTIVSDFDIFLIADVSDVDVVTGFPKYKKVMAKDLPSIVNTASDITYADLLAKATEGELSVGEFYNITDSDSGISPILVQAVSDSAIGYLAFDGENPLLTINYDFITDTVRWSKDQDSEPVALDSFSAVTPLSYDDVTGVFTISQSSATTDGYLASEDWEIFNDKQDALNGTGLVKSTAGTISYITDSSANWDSAYNDTITSAAVTGTTSKLLTLTQRDGGTITTSWSDLNSVTSVFGRTGAVIAQTGDYTTTQVTEGTNLYYTQDRFNAAFSLKTTSDLTEGTNLYYTDLRARSAFSETVTGLSYNTGTGVLSTTAGYGIPTTASQTQWDTAYANRIISASAPLQISNNTISIPQASSSTNGYLSSANWNTFNSKQPAGDYITALTGEATASGPNSAVITLSNSAVTGKVLAGLDVTGGSISSSDTLLSAFGKVQNQINGLIGGTVYQGTWNANSNEPILQSGVGVKGHYYIVNVAGSTNLDGITDWNLGDWAIYDGSAWQQVDNTDAVISVNGQIGIVDLTTTNISEGTNLYFTQTRVSANTDVAANTAARHSAVTLGTASGLSLSGQQLSLGLSSSSATGALSSTDWSTFNAKQTALNGTGIVKSVGGTISYLTDNSSNWNAAYNDKINSASVTGTDYKTLTLYQQDGGTITASWTDYDTAPVTSVFGRVGDVAAQTGDYTTSQVTEGTNLYFTDLRVSNNADVFANTAARHNAVTIGTANGLSLSTQQLSLALASTSTNGALSSTDWNTFNNKQNALGFTPEPAITAGTTAQYWRGDKSWQTLDTSVVPENTNLYYTSARFNSAFATKTTTNLTEGTNLYFTNTRAQDAITLTTTGTSGVATYVGGTLNIPDYSSALGAYLPLSGGTLTGALYGTTATFSGVVSAKGSAPYYQWLNASDVRLAYIQHNGSDLVIATDTGDIVFNPNGKVGIKNAAPSQNLTIGDGTETGNQYVRVFASASDIYIGQSGGTLFGQSANSAGFVLSDNVDFPFAIGTIAAKDLILGTNNTARFTLNGSTGAVTATSSITASSFVKSGGTSSQALLADGSVGTFSASNWNTAYNDSIVSAAVTGTSTKLLTLNQQDGGTITASWSESSAPVVSVFGRTGAILAAEGDYSLTQLSDVTITTPSNGQVLKYNGTAWVNGTDTDTGLTSVGLTMPSAFSVTNSPLTANGTLAVTGAGTTAQYVRGDGSLATFPSLSGYVPYTGATADVNLGLFDLYTAKVWLKDVPNDTYGSMELTDGVLHFEDGDGHSMVTMEDGYLTIANASTIRALLDVSALSVNRDFAFPNASGTLALTSDLSSYVPTTRTVSTTSPLTGGGALSSDLTLSIGESSASTNGYLSSGNFTKFNTAYNDSIVSAAVTGTTTKLLTLNQQDGGTITASWSDYDTFPVTSVFGRTGAVVAASGDYTTTQVTEGTNLYYTDARFNTSFAAKSTTFLTEGTNLYYTDARARGAISVTATGLNYSSGVISLASGYVIPTTTQQTNWNNVYTNAVYTTSTYSNPSWLTTLAWSKISGTPTTVSGYGITDAITTANIGSQSVNYAASAGALTSMNISQFTNDSGYITSSALSGYLPLTGGTLTGSLTISGASHGIIFDNPASYSEGLTFKSSGTSIWSINKGAGDGSENWNFYNFGRGTKDFSLSNSTGAATFLSSVTASSFIKSGGTSSQFLKADGSVDSSKFVGANYNYNVPMTQTGDWIGMSTVSGISGWTHVLNMAWSEGSQADWVSQIAFAAQTGTGAYYRTTSGDITSASWTRLIDSSNYGSYALPLTGGTLTGALALTTTSTALNYNSLSILQPNFTSTYGNFISIGVANSSKNSAAIQFNYQGGAGSTNNFVELSLYATSGLKIYGSGAATFASTINSGGIISAPATDGFANATWAANVRNPIWRFGNAAGYGISYFQGSSGVSGGDTIGIHFGTPTAAGSTVQFNSNGTTNFASNIYAYYAHLGYWSVDADFARFGHSSFDGTNSYGFMQNNSGLTFVGSEYSVAIETPLAYVTGGLVAGATTMEASAILQADSLTQGFLPPRMTDNDMVNLPSPAAGLVIYNTDLTQLCLFNGTGWYSLNMTAL
jgi:hypothetical protein